MSFYDTPPNQRKLNAFASQQRDRTLAFLQGTYSLSRSDCEDVFQEAFIILHQKIIGGELVLTASLPTYFLGICKNKAQERLRANGRRELNIMDELSQTHTDEFEDERIDSVLALENDTRQIEERKEAIVREIVSHLPSPCNEILWGFYRDGLSMKTLALMHNYSSESSVKVTKHRCTEKFKARFLEVSRRILD